MAITIDGSANTIEGITALPDLAEGGLADAKIINADIKDDTISEAKLDIHAAPSGTDKYLAYTSNGMEWATVAGGLDGVTTGSGNVTISDGDLIVGTAGHGIDFSATANSAGSMGSELFDDYEEGTWTPVIGGTSISHGTRSAWYTKIGNLVYFGLYITLDSGTANDEITGLPYSVSTGEVYNVFANWTYHWHDWTCTYDEAPIVTKCVAGGSGIKLYQTRWQTGNEGFPSINYGGGETGNFYGTGFYRHG